MLSRREFLHRTTAACLMLPAAATAFGAEKKENGATPIPSYLKGYEDLYARDPRAAALKWFVDAKYGLFLHYALGSLIPGGKPVIKKGGIDWQEQFKHFTAEKFDADAITDLALAAKMRYVTLTTRHLGGMCLYRTSTTTFSSVNAPAHRDLVGEMAKACQKRGLGFFTYVPPETARTDPDILETNKTQLRELLTNYGPLAGIWFDGIGYYHKDPSKYTRLRETFALVRSLQPQCLVSFKTGTLGVEDFLAPEHGYERKPGRLPSTVWEKLKDKPVEVCTTLQENRQWINQEGARHKTADEVIKTLRSARGQGFNLLLNAGLRGDGSVHPDDAAALRAAGKIILETHLLGS